MSKVEISVVVDSEIRYIREDWLPREDAEISSITSCELPINGLCLWSSRFHGHEVILPYATIVWNMEEFLLAAIHHGEAGAGHDSSEHVPQRYNDLRTAIADWRMKLQSNNGIEHLFEKEKCKLINTENLQLTILLRDLDKELLNFQRRRAIRALETGSPPLSVLVDSAISFLAYEAGIHVAQIRSTSILDYLSCVAKNLKDMHTQLRTDDDFNFALKSRIKVKRSKDYASIGDGVEIEELTQVWKNMLQAIPSISSKRSDVILRQHKQPAELLRFLNFSSSAVEFREARVEEMEQPSDKKLEILLSRVFRCYSPHSCVT